MCLSVMRNNASVMQINDCTVNQIDARLSACDNIENSIDVIQKQAEAMRQSILKEAFEGRLV